MMQIVAAMCLRKSTYPLRMRKAEYQYTCTKARNKCIYREHNKEILGDVDPASQHHRDYVNLGILIHTLASADFS